MTELRAPRLTCREVVELLSDYLEGALSGSERARVEEHLDTCPQCTAYLVQLRATIGAPAQTFTADIHCVTSWSRLDAVGGAARSTSCSPTSRRSASTTERFGPTG